MTQGRPDRQGQTRRPPRAGGPDAADSGQEDTGEVIHRGTDVMAVAVSSLQAKDSCI